MTIAIIMQNVPEICDFCSSPEVVVGYNIPDFELPEFGFGSKGGFAACAVCRDLIEDNQREKLMKRSVDTFASKYPMFSRMYMYQFINVLHREFWKRLTRREHNA